MLTKEELDYLLIIPENQKVSVKPFSLKAKKVGDSIVSKVKKALSNLEVLFMGATALGIAGQNDIDIYALAPPKDFNKYLPIFEQLFGKPKNTHKTFIEWSFMEQGHQVELYLTDLNSPSMQRQIKVFNVLSTNPRILRKYEDLKLSFDRKGFSDYQRTKYEFYHQILDNKIKAILFDMVGVLVFKKNGYSLNTTDEINTQNIEGLFNHLDDKKLLKDIKEKLKLSDEEIKKASSLIPSRYEKFTKLWDLLSELKKKYKLAVINNGNSIALKYWKEKFDFGIFDLFINSTEERVKKPDPKIFLLACKKLNVKPAECLFMDDSLENIESAQKLGIKTIWWNKENEKEYLLKEFAKLV